MQHHHTQIWKCKLETQAPPCMADLRHLGPLLFRSGRCGSLDGHTVHVYQGSPSLTLQKSEREGLADVASICLLSPSRRGREKV